MTRTNAFTTGLAGAATLFLTAAFAAPAASQESVLDRTGRWLGAGGQQLPFTDDQQVLDFLRTAEIVASEEISGTSSDPHKVLLEKDGLRVHAIFRTVEVQRDKLENDVKHARGFRDSYVFEVAAYELSRLLELDNVPPAVVRKVGRQEGSMQLWIEHAMGVAERLESGIREEHAQLWQFQKQNMQIFDSLIYNFDRNPSNILIDHSGKLWFVDHTRSFKNLPSLSGRDKIQVCERRLWERLRDLDPEQVREQLAPYLNAVEIGALLKRQQKLVKLLERRIAQKGENAVLFEFTSS